MEIMIKNEKLVEEIGLKAQENRLDWKKSILIDIEAQQRRNQYAYGMEQYRRCGRKVK